MKFDNIVTPNGRNHSPNRTILELKYFIGSVLSLNFEAPNRTILELKYVFKYLPSTPDLAPNRTVVELK